MQIGSLDDSFPDFGGCIVILFGWWICRLLEHRSGAHVFWVGHMMRICLQTHDGRLRHFVCHVAIIFYLMSLTLVQLGDMLPLMNLSVAAI